MKHVIPCYKEHDKSCIWYYYTYMTYQKPFWTWFRICVKFFFLRNIFNSAHTDIYDTSIESCVQRLYFFFIHLRALSNLWGRYDPKTEKKLTFLLVTVSFCHIESSVIPPMKVFMKGFISSSYTDEL